MKISLSAVVIEGLAVILAFFENMKIPEEYETTKNFLMLQPCNNNGISGPLKNCNCVI